MEDGYARLRSEMIDAQLRARGVVSEPVLAAMGRLPRELFVRDDWRPHAYEDAALPIAEGQSISQPYIVGRMTELLDPQPGRRILEIGTGSGYQAAVLATIGCRVVSIERHPGLARDATALLTRLDLGALVTIVLGDGSLGRPDEAPFDGVLVTAAAPRIPPALPDQLVDGGRLVAPIGRRELQELVLLVRAGREFRRYDCGPCVFVPLVGVEGYGEAPRAGPERL